MRFDVLLLGQGICPFSRVAQVVWSGFSLFSRGETFGAGLPFSGNEDAITLGFLFSGRVVAFVSKFPIFGGEIAFESIFPFSGKE